MTVDHRRREGGRATRHSRQHLNRRGGRSSRTPRPERRRFTPEQVAAAFEPPGLSDSERGQLRDWWASAADDETMSWSPLVSTRSSPVSSTPASRPSSRRSRRQSPTRTRPTFTHPASARTGSPDGTPRTITMSTRLTPYTAGDDRKTADLPVSPTTCWGNGMSLANAGCAESRSHRD